MVGVVDSTEGEGEGTDTRAATTGSQGEVSHAPCCHPSTATRLFRDAARARPSPGPRPTQPSRASSALRGTQDAAIGIVSLLGQLLEKHAGRTGFDRLIGEEHRVLLALVERGQSDEQIVERTQIPLRTVQRRLKSARRKLEAANRVD